MNAPWIAGRMSEGVKGLVSISLAATSASLCVSLQFYWLSRYLLEADNPLRNELLGGAWICSLMALPVLASCLIFGLRSRRANSTLRGIVVLESVTGLVIVIGLVLHAFIAAAPPQ